MIAADNIPSLQSIRSKPNYAHIGSLVFHRSLKLEYFECLHDDVELSTSNGGFRPFPWGYYTYGKPLFKDHRSAISAEKDGFQDKVYSKL